MVETLGTSIYELTIWAARIVGWTLVAVVALILVLGILEFLEPRKKQEKYILTTLCLVGRGVTGAELVRESSGRLKRSSIYTRLYALTKQELVTCTEVWDSSIGMNRHLWFITEKGQEKLSETLHER